MTARYEAIAQRVARSIRDGVLRPGERLPSLRSLCRSEGISLMTSLAAYQRLEAQGLIEALPRSGFRVLSTELPVLSRPAIPRARFAAHSGSRDALVSHVLAAAADPGLVPLGLGTLPSDLYPLAALRRITGHLLAARPELWGTYALTPGAPELRRAIARRLRARGLEVEADEVLITIGAMEALSIGLRVLVRPGDIVLVECPTFFGILDAARGTGARVIELPGDPAYGLDPARVAALCKRQPVRAAILMPTFANPTGSAMDDRRKHDLSAVLREHGVAVLEDDLYAELAHDRTQSTPLAEFARRRASPWLLAGSLSKSLLPGARIGYLVAQSPLIDRAIEVKQSTSLANNTLAEHLATECLGGGLFDRHLGRLLPRLEQNMRRMQSAVVRHFPSGTRISEPRGGFLCWLELPEGGDGLALFRAAHAAGISIAPGSLFTLAGGLERFVRLNAATSSGVDAALETLGALARAQLTTTAPHAKAGLKRRARRPSSKHPET